MDWNLRPVGISGLASPPAAPAPPAPVSSAANSATCCRCCDCGDGGRLPLSSSAPALRQLRAPTASTILLNIYMHVPVRFGQLGRLGTSNPIHITSPSQQPIPHHRPKKIAFSAIEIVGVSM